MRHGAGFTFRYLLIAVCLILCGSVAYGQSTLGGGNIGQPTTLNNAPQRDTNSNKTNTAEWKDGTTRIYYQKLNSDQKYKPDTSLEGFHRRPFSQPWNENLGNLGSPQQSLLFRPEDDFGPTLGYHVFDAYRYDLDSLKYYNTTHPYTAFTYQLGSKLEQMAEITHTQNIKPYWNFAFNYKKINSPGFFKIQRNNHDNGSFSTNYTSPGQHYQLYAAIVYNKEQHDENGGITNDSELLSPTYNDRRTVDVAYQDDYYSTVRSSVTNMLRDFGVLLQHSYTWGTPDTLYNADSTHYTYKLIPRFRITHKMELSSEKHEFKDVIPDSLRYVGLFNQSFNNGLYYSPGVGDSVFSQQKWFYIDNRVLLNGFLGKEGKQVEFNAGIGNRIDQFTTYYAIGSEKNNILSNYLIGSINKEALQPGQWFYKANAQFFLTGDAAGDFLINANVGKELNNNIGNFSAGFTQQLNSAPYSYSLYENQYYKLATSFNKESVTQVFGAVSSPRLKLSLGIRNYTIENYIYINQDEKPDQYAPAYNLTQIWLRKKFRFGKFVLDNELAYQQLAGNAPVNAPAMLGRHQLGLETSLFNDALKIATGVEVDYNTAYKPSGYDPLLNKFYYQNAVSISNAPVGIVFFDFQIKRFRAYVMGDQIQEAFTKNKINYPGYPSQDIMIRFGFTWVMIN